MKKNRSLFILFACVFITWGSILISRHTSSWELKKNVVSHVTIDSTFDVTNSEYTAYLAPIKAQLNATMSGVIGVAAESMTGHQPESLLSNWTSDAILHAANALMNEPIHVAIMNMGGLRCEIPKGDITLWKMFELMPFDNELVILTLTGNDLKDLCDGFAADGGQGVAGLRFQIKNDKAQNILVAGEPIDVNKEDYKIAVSNYLAEGNDRMIALTRCTNTMTTGLKLRDLFVDFVKEETAQGREIKSQLDGRITVID